MGKAVRHSVWGKQYASAGCQLPDTQHKILAESPETKSRSAAFWGVLMFSESGGKGQGILVKELLLKQGFGEV